mmetsp:Transcript_12032/g.21137  ORF Transcript_12032/g.21137 Transcript_12032/m.21137 type:complete len:1058 (+) Transcript_12032:77-3250(+)
MFSKKRTDKTRDGDASACFSSIGTVGSTATSSPRETGSLVINRALTEHSLATSGGRSDFGQKDSLKSGDSPGTVGHVTVDMRLTWDLYFVDKELEREYERQMTPRLCTRSVFPFAVVFLYSVYSACLGSIFDKEKTMLLAKTLQAPVIAAYNGCWVIVGVLSLVMLGLSWRGKRFRAWHRAEIIVAVTVAIIMMMRVFLGNRWRVSQFFNSDPEEIFGAYSQDTELLMNHVTAVAYFGMYTPMRFRAFVCSCCVTSLVSFGASTAICGSPGENWVRDFVLCVIVVGLLSVGQRQLEKRHRFCWMQQRADRLHIAQLEDQSRRQKEKLTEQQEEQNFLQSHLDALSTLAEPDRPRGSARVRRPMSSSVLSKEMSLTTSMGSERTLGRDSLPCSQANSMNSTGGTGDCFGGPGDTATGSLEKITLPAKIIVREVETRPDSGQSNVAPSGSPKQAELLKKDHKSKSKSYKVPNKALATQLARAKPTRWDLVKQCVRMLRNPYYSLKDFHEHVTAAFPELLLYSYVGDEDAGTKSIRSTSLHTAEQEYQRTIGALYAIYWLMRIDMNGKLGFCFGHNAETMELNVKDASMVPSKPGEDLIFFKMDEQQKRANLYHTFPWERFTEIFVKSGCLTSDMRVCEERCEAMLALTAIHDIFKNEAFLPAVAEGHVFEGYTEGCVIQDHDQALNYILVHYPEALPSYAGLNHKQRKVVAFTQGKMGFNNGWLVQAEAPPKALFSTFKKLITSGGATEEDVSFYFVHWLTDLAGAVPTPLCGSEQFVLKFPDYVLAAFLRSFSYVWSLATRSETEVMESYLVSSWVDSRQDCPVPQTEDAVAQMRIFLQAQRFGRAAVRAYHNLEDCDRNVLASEMNKTGIVDQAYSSDFSARQSSLSQRSWTGQQVPALLIYYGPALLQNNISLDENQCLKALAEVYRAARAIWPLEDEPVKQNVSADGVWQKSEAHLRASVEQAGKAGALPVVPDEAASSSACATAIPVDSPSGPSVVTIRVEQLKDLVSYSQAMDRFEGYFLVKKNAQEGVVEHHPLDVVNTWNETPQVYRYLCI